MSDLFDAYRFHRQCGSRAIDAVRYAREDVARGTKRYPHAHTSSVMGAANESGHAWCEDVHEIGLRFVGYADEIVNLRHTGWFADNFQDETFRGAVWQWPARNGEPRYVAGYGDPNNEGAARLDMTSITDDKTEAAYRADRVAERDAESEREYQEAADAGQYYLELAEEAAEARKAALAILAEAKRARALGTFPALREAVCRKLRDYLDDRTEAYDKRDQLLADWGRTPGFVDTIGEG